VPRRTIALAPHPVAAAGPHQRQVPHVSRERQRRARPAARRCSAAMPPPAPASQDPMPAPRAVSRRRPIPPPPHRCVPTARCSAISAPDPPSHHFDAPMSSPLLLPTTGDRSEHRDRFPLGKLDRCATVSTVSGEDHRSHASLHISPVQLTPHLPLPLTSPQVNAGVFPALESHPPPSEHRHADSSPPPHRRPTSSISRATSHLAWRIRRVMVVL
jgi:hypothetical protein